MRHRDAEQAMHAENRVAPERAAHDPERGGAERDRAERVVEDEVAEDVGHRYARAARPFPLTNATRPP